MKLDDPDLARAQRWATRSVEARRLLFTAAREWARREFVREDHSIYSITLVNMTGKHVALLVKSGLTREKWDLYVGLLTSAQLMDGEAGLVYISLKSDWPVEGAFDVVQAVELPEELRVPDREGDRFSWPR